VGRGFARGREALWNNVYTTDAPKRLDALIEKSGELSKCATHLPYRKGLMEKWQDHVIRERVPGYKAALT
jgi:hypothetical protein